MTKNIILYSLFPTALANWFEKESHAAASKKGYPQKAFKLESAPFTLGVLQCKTSSCGLLTSKYNIY